MIYISKGLSDFTKVNPASPGRHFNLFFPPLWFSDEPGGIMKKTVLSAVGYFISACHGYPDWELTGLSY
jgi:hypothetical protein